MNGRRRFLVSILLIVTLMIFAAGIQKSASAAWWDKFGKPEYGGEFVQATTNLDAQFDTLSFIGLNNDLWFSVPLFESDWTLDPEIYPTGSFFVPEKYCVPYASEKWELRDPRSFVVYLKKGIKWQNKPPVNGREFTAQDIVASMKRRMGPGSMFAGMLSSWEDVIAEIVVQNMIR